MSEEERKKKLKFAHIKLYLDNSSDVKGTSAQKKAIHSQSFKIPPKSEVSIKRPTFDLPPTTSIEDKKAQKGEDKIEATLYRPKREQIMRAHMDHALVNQEFEKAAHIKEKMKILLDSTKQQPILDQIYNQPVTHRTKPKYRPMRALTERDQFLKGYDNVSKIQIVPCGYHPFKNDYPSFHYLNPKHAIYYRYWSDEFIKGRVHETDPGYILLLVFEIINKLKITDPKEGYEILHRLWFQYKSVHNRIRYELPRWIAEYLYLNNCPPAILINFAREVHETVSKRAYFVMGLPHFIFSLINRQESHGSEILDIFLGNHYEKPFFQKELEEFKLQVDAIFHSIDDYFLSTENKHLLSLYDPYPREQLAYYRARYYVEPRKYTLKLLSPVGYRNLPKEMLNILKIIQNHFRNFMELPGSLKTYPTTPILQTLIDMYYIETLGDCKARPKHPGLYAKIKMKDFKLDLGKVEKLTKESDEVEELLTLEGENELISSIQEIPIPMQVSESDEIIITDTQSTDVHSSADFTHNGEGTIEEEFIKGLKPFHLNIIKSFLTSNNPQAKINRISQEIGRLPEVLIEEINVIALEYLGDIVIENGELLEDYLPVFDSLK